MRFRYMNWLRARALILSALILFVLSARFPTSSRSRSTVTVDCI
ncbi:MAG: hypothetical protein WA783_16595 [Phormidesmis sp.]